MSAVNLALRPIHYASVSGGKDSLYMMKVILANPQKYPLDLVVNYDLEIEPPVAHKVAGKIKEMCDRIGVPFWSIKPRRSYQELEEKYYLPTRVARWCNSKYKLDCEAQLVEWIKAQNCRPVAYIGLCADEARRFRDKVGDWKDEQRRCYPLAEEGIEEEMILAWAKEQEIFDGFYLLQKRMGCIICPCASMRDRAIAAIRYPELFAYWCEKMNRRDAARPPRREPWANVERRIREKWVPKVMAEMKEATK